MLLCFMPHVGTDVVSEVLNTCAYTNLDLTHAHPLTLASTHTSKTYRLHISQAIASLVWLTEPSKTLQGTSQPLCGSMHKRQDLLGQAQYNICVELCLNAGGWVLQPVTYPLNYQLVCDNVMLLEDLFVGLTKALMLWIILELLVLWTCMLTVTNITFFLVLLSMQL